MQPNTLKQQGEGSSEFHPEIPKQQGKGSRISTASERRGQPNEARPARSARNEEQLILALLLECLRVESWFFFFGGCSCPAVGTVEFWAFLGRRPPRCHHVREGGLLAVHQGWPLGRCFCAASGLLFSVELCAFFFKFRADPAGLAACVLALLLFAVPAVR